MKKHTFLIDAVPPFDFDISTHSHRYKRYHYDEYDRRKGFYKKAVEFDGRQYLIQLSGNGEIDRPRITVQIIGKSITVGALAFIREIIKKQFLTDSDIRPFYKVASKDKILASICKRYRGLKPNWPGDLFECLTRCIISQQINVNFADKVEMNYVRRFGKKIVHEGESFYVFPDARTAASIRKRDLLKLQFSERKAEYILDLARGIAGKKIDLDHIEKLPASEFGPEITKIRGIGRWTAECALMHLGHKNVLPRGDIGLHRAIRLFYGQDERTSIETLLKVTDRWDGWKTLGTYYLWHALTDARNHQEKA